ncbi:trans-sialidase [Trypanosoma cruzi cruzi]|uniref:Putative trans-sialidase, Group V n=1 Tax=Trypanosoma cruzi TaxID=5693 RepID=A0A2V2VBN0_TRYCR|nr:trans-sialidase [Trypanosoma cruzi cruzi]PWU93810.1 putative trans-sialidase, Group V [Trypanosoma cruzi]
MLSRVAAVKAPRTHNRRRVTGSSGRRREGRESEPQRPNMSRHLFYSALLLLLFVMMCCNAGVVAEAEEHSSESKVKWKDIKDEEGGVTVESLGVPGLLNVGSDVFAVAEAQCKKNSESITFTGIASQILTIDNDNSPVEVLNGAEDKTQFLEDGSADLKKKVDVSRPTTILKGNDIYMLAGKYSRTSVRGAQGSGGGADDGGLLFVKGEVCEENGSGKRIKWKDTTDVPQASVGERHSWSRLIGGGGSGVHTHDGRLLFPAEGTKQKETDTEKDVKTVSLLIYSSDNAASWKLSKGMSADGCSDPSVVEWKDKKLMMMTACDDGRRRVYESVDKGESWTEALGTLSRVWGNRHTGHEKRVGSGFTTAKIDNRDVMLVTLPVYAKNESEEKEKKNAEKGVLHLWLTDNTHIADIGPVSDDDVAASSLLYKSGDNNEKKEEKLIAMYEKKKVNTDKTSHSLWSVPLTEQLQRVKDVLQTWKEVDQTVSKLCPSSAGELLSTGSARRDFKITDGLVGFLSGKFSENTWSDEYLGVNATVKENGGGAAAATGYADNGVTLRGAWAEWPVGEQGENQLYHFANYKFTLVATVSIDKVQEGDTPISLMGVKMNDSGKTVLLGLSYNKEKKWQLLCGGGPIKELSSTWEPEETHQLAIVLQNGTHGSAYVDDRRVGGNEACALGNKDSEAISHFYIGGDGGAKGVSGVQDVSVTVTNVLLYNRPLDDEEIAALTKNKITNPKREVPKTSTTSPLSPAVSGSDVQGTVPLSNSARQPPSEQGQPKGSIGAGAGGASAPATSTAADSSSDGDPRVGAEAGGAMQGDTPPQTPVDNPDKADANAPIATEVAQVDPADTTEVSVSSGENGETTEGRYGQGELHAQHGEVNATALNSDLGNISQGNNSDGGTVSESRMLPSLLLLLLGLWGLAAL